MIPLQDTEFAPAERVDQESINRQFDRIASSAGIGLLDCFPLPVLMLNGNRQVAYSNKAFLDILGLENARQVLGRRPGEVFNCIYSDVHKGGCGTAAECSQCGAVLAILESIEEGRTASKDCQLLSKGDDIQAMDLRVTSVPFEFDGEQFYAVTVMDIADEKRREVMEQVFFHDILNSAGSAQSLVRILYAEVSADFREPLHILDQGLTGLVEEIQSHKQLRQVERGDYPLSLMTIQSLEMMQNIAREMDSHILAEGRSVVVDSESENGAIKTDYALLRRVLVNMVKNAVEATSYGGKITMGCFKKDGEIGFYVHNDAVMTEETKLQIFKRSFSTKGKGRGLGTYSMRLLTENYLKGKLRFTSREGEGTRFVVLLPEAESVC